MDSILLQHPLLPHIFMINSRCFSGSRIVGYKNRPWSSTCCAVGVSDNLFDENSTRGNNENGSLLGSGLDAPFVTVDAEITPETIDFFVSDAEGDPDCPSEGFSSIEQALSALRQGKVGTLFAC